MKGNTKTCDLFTDRNSWHDNNKIIIENRGTEKFVDLAVMVLEYFWRYKIK